MGYQAASENSVFRALNEMRAWSPYMQDLRTLLNMLTLENVWLLLKIFIFLLSLDCGFRCEVCFDHRDSSK